MIRRLWFVAVFSAVAMFSLLAVSCGDDDDDDGGNAAERQEIADLALDLATLNGADATQEQIDFYLAHVTDEFLQEFGTESVEACAEDAPTCIGEPLEGVTVDPEAVEIDGDSATVVVGSDFGPQGLDLIKEDDTWKANGLFVADDEIAEGTEVVELGLDEFAFEGDLDSDAVKSGDFAFHVTNNGEQPHEAILVPLPAEGTIEELLQDQSFEPEPIFVKFAYGPGEESDVALPAPLEAGRYGLVCFLPDTSEGVGPDEATPHALKGMVAEFTVE